MFTWVFNPILWFLRIVFGLLTGAAIVVGIAFFFVHGWFFAGMACIMYAEFCEFHNGCREAFKHDKEQSLVEYGLNYKAPVGTARTLYGRDLASAGLQDAHEHILVLHQTPTILCPGCSVRYERPFPRRCRHCAYPLEQAPAQAA